MRALTVILAVILIIAIILVSAKILDNLGVFDGYNAVTAPEGMALTGTADARSTKGADLFIQQLTAAAPE